MPSRNSRSVISFALIFVLFFGITGAVAAQQPQDSKSPQTQQQSQTPASSIKPTTIPSKTNTKPLSEDEDPSLIGKRKINKGLIAKMSMSVEKEVAMGRQLAAEVDKQAKFIDDPIITEYVNRVAQNLVLHSDAKIPFTVKVIDSDEVNAFALPGGFFYVNKGLILAADNEAELAGVMAHEISHVIARHAVENQTKANLMQYGMLAGILLGGPILSNVLYNGGGFFEGIAFLKFSRNAESEADKLGTEYLYAAGYDPTAMATMFEKLEGKEKKKPGTMSKLFKDHPAPADRRAASLALAARFPEREEYVISSSEFQRVKARLLRLSNARATATGAIGGADDGTPGRPTLKRRQPTPNDSTTTPDGTTKPDSTKPAPPTLKREPEPQAKPTPQP
ncbi:MAG TPA: M48 family metalloprotease [Pyrinomonadaceae bacterium]|nr:M48 family metalloprotease [Pyrinomonadaceae bacterium]